MCTESEGDIGRKYIRMALSIVILCNNEGGLLVYRLGKGHWKGVYQNGAFHR